MMIRMLLSAALFLPLAVAPQAAESARSMGTLQASITIVSACSTQQALFGSQAESSADEVTVICQPGMTPFLTQSVDLSNTDTDAGGGAGQGGTASATGGATGSAAAGGPVSFDLMTKNEVLSPPLPSASTFASKVIYVMF